MNLDKPLKVSVELPSYVWSTVLSSLDSQKWELRSHLDARERSNYHEAIRGMIAELDEAKSEISLQLNYTD